MVLVDDRDHLILVLRHLFRIVNTGDCLFFLDKGIKFHCH